MCYARAAAEVWVSEIFQNFNYDVLAGIQKLLYGMRVKFRNESFGILSPSVAIETEEFLCIGSGSGSSSSGRGDYATPFRRKQKAFSELVNVIATGSIARRDIIMK